MKIFVISDIHGEKKYLKKAEHLVAAADAIIISGDLSLNHERKSAEEFIDDLSSVNSTILAVHGNWDSAEVIDMLSERGLLIHADGRTVDGIGFFGSGGSSPTPLNTPTEYSEEEILAHLESGYQKVKNSEKKVLISHTPPKKTRDRTFLGIRGGSVSVRKFIEMNEISLCLCGHIHEAYGTEKLGSAIIVNSGAFSKGRYSIVDINDSVNVYADKL